MNPVSVSLIRELRPRIIERRARLETAARTVPAAYVHDLLAEVDAALERIDNGSYGLCESCREPIETARLERDPLERYCLDHLTAREMRAHEQDLELATQIQTQLLPAKDVKTPNWETHFCYQPAGVVGGDYCEILTQGNAESMFFALGDVAGKGVAASLLMTHLSAIFRSLVSLDMPLAEMMSRANRLFCESTPSTHYATLVAGRTTETGVELCNAGHCRPLALRSGGIEPVEATGLPLGLFCAGQYGVSEIRLAAGESLVLYSDGVSEAQGVEGGIFEEAGVMRSLLAHEGLDAAEMVERLMQDVARVRGAGAQEDDMTVLIVRRR